MRRPIVVCAMLASAACVSAARAGIFFVGGHVSGTTDGSGNRSLDNSSLTFTTNPGSFDIGPGGGSGGTSGGLTDGIVVVGSSHLAYNLSAGSRSTDFVQIIVDGEASFNDYGGAYYGSIGSAASANGTFRYTGPASPFFARRVIDGLVVPGAWFAPVPGTGASLDGGIITPGDYSFSLSAFVDSATNPSEIRLSELIIPAPPSVLALGLALLGARRRRA